MNLVTMLYLCSFVIFALLTSPATSLWSCVSNQECSSSLSGSVCQEGECVCPAGTESSLGGTVCADIAPYLNSPCVESSQCSRLFTSFQCSVPDESTVGTCTCQPGFHYFLGRCWESKDFGAACTRDEECMGVLRDPYSLACSEGTCTCADQYYERQRGECRRIGYAVGDGCVLDEDCQFEGGACDVSKEIFTCYNINDVPAETVIRASKMAANVTSTNMATRQHGGVCSAVEPCSDPFVCVNGFCVCPIGYYASANGLSCFANLGSPATEEQCQGLFALIRDGVCNCPANFYFEDNMVDCVKATRRLTESCVTDSNCHTFGVATRCSDPQEPWGLRSCECIPELAVWDAGRDMCRLFAGVGDFCEADSDCLAGELEIECMMNGEGQGVCTCPAGLSEMDGLCLTAGLELGDSCQATPECSGTENTVCEEGRCSCTPSYQELDGYCAPVIGGSCLEDQECVINNTVCSHQDGSSCQCADGYLEYDDACWILLDTVTEDNTTCVVNAQCEQAVGPSVCSDGNCECLDQYHLRDGWCWPIRDLFAACSRSSECYLQGMSDRVVCRNGLCQCQFEYPYSEELTTCTSSATTILGNLLTIITLIVITV